MTLDVRIQCSVCAWRENCTKKHTIRETLLHCPDFCRDERLKPEERTGAGPERHKRVEDVFGDG